MNSWGFVSSSFFSTLKNLHFISVVGSSTHCWNRTKFSRKFCFFFPFKWTCHACLTKYGFGLVFGQINWIDRSCHGLLLGPNWTNHGEDDTLLHSLLHCVPDYRIQSDRIILLTYLKLTSLIFYTNNIDSPNIECVKLLVKLSIVSTLRRLILKKNHFWLYWFYQF